MATDPSSFVVAEHTTATLPGNPLCRVSVPRAMPSVTILIHGVNDVGEAYSAQEGGLCQGLNERLDRTGDGQPLAGADYSVPNSKRPDSKLPDPQMDDVVEDPDAVYYHRRPSEQTFSPVIPFYWGFRETEAQIDKGQKHGEWLDRYGNRLDKKGAKSGGPFANATSNLPDMWHDGFSGKVLIFSANALGGSPTHPVLKARERHYMVLAAKRLAGLITIIRKRQPNDTVNLVGHSQGCLISLLAQAFLQEAGQRPADCLILNHPPYSLEETFLEHAEVGRLWQTSGARLATLVNLVKAVTDMPHATPPFADLSDAAKCDGMTGPQWNQKKSIDGKVYAFADRDNRGKVYLYFCPDDWTVSLRNVQGIGWQGVRDRMRIRDGEGVNRTENVLAQLGERFKQRVFTSIKRDGLEEPVGKASPYVYALQKKGERRVRLTNTGFDNDETRTITGEAIDPPYVPRVDIGDTLGNRHTTVGPIDAAIAVTNGGIRDRYDAPFFVEHCGLSPEQARDAYIVPDWRDAGRQGRPLTRDEIKQTKALWNGSKPVADQARIHDVQPLSDGRLMLDRAETPNEAKLRWMRCGIDDNSYHSGIVANPEHSRRITAYDLAIGQAVTIDDRDFAEYLRLVADWRTEWEEIRENPQQMYKKPLELYGSEVENIKRLIDANYRYYITGEFPQWVLGKGLPPLVVSRTLDDELKPKDKDYG